MGGSWAEMSRTPKILARNSQGELLALNRVRSKGQPDKWWSTGPGYGLGSEHGHRMKRKLLLSTGLMPAGALIT
jgi:hypothetical protein